MIKWLKEIRVLSHESRNHYHYHDNKILPPTVDAERAIKEGWWYRQEYILNELSLNSVITQPNHGDELPIARNINNMFEIEGTLIRAVDDPCCGWKFPWIKETPG